MANTSSTNSSPAGSSRNQRGNKGGGEPQSEGGDKGPRAERPTRPSDGNKTGLNLDGEAELSQDDPDHELRGEDQLVDGVSEVVIPGGLEEDK